MGLPALEGICGKLGMEWLAHPPVYGTLWRVLALLEMDQVKQVLSRWVQGVGGEVISVDGKSLRGVRSRPVCPRWTSWWRRPSGFGSS